MGDILDLFLDFERKLLALLRDMFLRPHEVIESIQAKDKKYLGSFKFYSLVFSIWFVLLRLTNSWLRFYGEDWILPERLREYSQAQVDFSFFLAPFMGLVKLFLPIGLLSFLTFRRSRYSLLTHLAFATNIGGILMLYYLPMIFVITLITDSSLSQTWVAILGVTCLGLPIIYTTYVYIRVFTGRVWLKALKGIGVVGICVVFFLMLDSIPVDDYIHKNVFYRKYIRFEITPNLPESSWRAVAYDDPHRVFWQSNTSRHSHAYVSATPSSTDAAFGLVIASGSDTITTPLKNTTFTDIFPRFIVTDLDNSIFVTRVDMDFRGQPGMTWLFDRKGSLIFHFDNVPDVNPITFAADAHGQIIVAGAGYTTKVPLVATGSDMKWKSFKGLKKFSIDEILCDSTGTMQLVVQHTENEKLREIRWLRGRISADSVHVDKELELYRNDFAPTLNGNFSPIHNSSLLRLDDGKSIVTYQVMTDSSFALDVTSVDVVSGQQLWNKTYSIPADMAFFQNTLYFEGRLYVFGTTTNIFPRGIMGHESRNPFILVIDASNGNVENTYFLPPETNFEGLQYFLEFEPMVYIDSRKIFWAVDQTKSYVITIDSLR